MFFPKLFVWFKNHGKSILTIITIVIAIYGGIQKFRANKWEKEAARLDGKLQEQIADQDLLYGEAAKIRAERRIAEAEEKKKREEIEAEKEKYKRESERVKRALAEEKKKTTLLPPSELVEEVAARIGDELTLTGDWLYLFTRTGTERTLDKFKDGEFYLSEYNKFQGVLADHEAEVESFNKSIKECEEEKVENLVGWNDCRETLNTAVTGREADKKVASAMVWQGRKQGAGAVIFIAGLLKIFGVW